MFSKLQLAVYCPANTTGSISLHLPSIDQITLSDFETLKNHVVRHSKSHSFIILLLDLNEQNSSPILEDIRKERHVFAIFIRVKSRCNLTFNGENVYPVAQQLIKRKIISSIIRFYEIASAQLLPLNYIHAHNFKIRANAMKDEQRSTNTPIEAPHILIIPMNTKEDHLWECQEKLIDICNGLCGDYEPRVCTLSDYFSSGKNRDLCEDEDIDINIKCDYIKRIAPFRLYLFGNEMHNLHSLSQSLFQHESNSSNEDEYDAKYTAIEYEPVTDQFKSHLANMLGYSTWQSTNIILKRLDEFPNDIKFPAAIERVNANIEVRAMVADVKLSQQATHHSASSIECSGAFHIIGQAQNGPSVQNDGNNEEIANIIQAYVPASFPQ